MYAPLSVSAGDFASCRNGGVESHPLVPVDPLPDNGPIYGDVETSVTHLFDAEELLSTQSFRAGSRQGNANIVPCEAHKAQAERRPDAAGLRSVKD
jgi:hypothetical protein